MKWSIEYYSPKVEEEVLNLPDGLLSRYFRLADLMLDNKRMLEVLKNDA